MKNLFIVAVAFLVLGLFQPGVNAAPLAVTPEAAFNKAFPQLKVDSITESQIKGLYEIISGQNVFYFSPEKDLLLVGDMYNSAGQNITGEKKRDLKAKFQQKAMEKVKDLPLEKAVKVGNGPKKVIEFTDPDCPYCRNGAIGACTAKLVWALDIDEILALPFTEGGSSSPCRLMTSGL